MMKKSLVLAMAMALGVTASAYAANPFSDVPAGHWAYDSVNKLAAAGIVDGYGNGTFGGDRLMTRYEMAQIVAKAMAKGANVDRLAAEFADELDSLGVRVAALEKKADNVKITGNIRAHYADYKKGAKDRNGSYGAKLRTRLFINGQINDNWSYTGRVQNIQNFRNDSGDEKTDFNWAFVQGKVGAVDIRAGRTWIYLGDGNIYDETFDGIVASFGKDVKLEAVYGKPTNSLGWDYDKVYGASLSGKTGALGLGAGYYKFDAANSATAAGVAKDDNEIWQANASYGFGKASVGAMYLHSDLDGERGGDGWVGSLNYGGAKGAKVGSFGLNAQYYSLPAGTVVAHTMNGEYQYSWGKNGDDNKGIKGYKIGAYYTVAKNMVAGVEYYDLKDKIDDNKYKTLWSQMIITF
ncbi:S-layer homology domain-containing protein [Phascolarctobacterium sp.]